MASSKGLQPADMTDDEAFEAAVAASMGNAPPPLPPKPAHMSPNAATPVTPISAFQLQQAEAHRRRRLVVVALLVVGGLAVCGVAIGLGAHFATVGSSGSTTSDSSSSGPLPPGTNLNMGCSSGGGIRIELAEDVWACPATWGGEPNMRTLGTGATCDDLTPCAVPADACATGFEPCGASGSLTVLATISSSSCASAGSSGQYYLGGASHADVSESPTCYYASNYPLVGDLQYYYGCASSGWAAQPVCCGPGCVTPTCSGAVWSGATLVSPSEQGCGAQPSPPQGEGGVLCCVMQPTAAPVPDLTDHGGQVMANPQFYAYYWGESWSQESYYLDKITGVEQFIKGLQNSTVASLITQYFRGATVSIAYAGYFVDTTAVPTFTNAPSTNPTTASNDALDAIATAAFTELCDHLRSSPSKPPTAQLEGTFYAIYMDATRPAWSDFCAFHDIYVCEGNGINANIPFGVFWDTSGDLDCTLSVAPSGRSQGLVNLASATLHELVESMTDEWSDACVFRRGRGSER